MKEISLELPLTAAVRVSMKTGDKVLLSGVIYTARDMAHKRMAEYLRSGQPLPFELNDAAIFYAGPTPARPGQICGVIGPTTSARMDKYTPELLKAGVKILIGKGERSSEVISAIRQSKAVYLVAIGGAAALLSKCVLSCETIAWQDLGTEAIHKLVVKDFPCYVSVL
jgi:fumarate hydratase subunit beta